MLKIYTDGACSPNPGQGGWAAVSVFDGVVFGSISGAMANTTCNRMEIIAVIKGLKTFKNDDEIEVISDSQYVVHALAKGWIENWKRRHWIMKGGEPVKNRDLWERLDIMRTGVKFTWERGHSGCPFNALCDELAVKARAQLYVEEAFNG